MAKSDQAREYQAALAERGATVDAGWSIGSLQFEAPAKLFKSGRCRNLRIGCYSYVQPGASLQGSATIGRYCSIAADLTTAPTAHPTDWLSTSTFQYGKREWAKELPPGVQIPRITDSSLRAVTIGNDVWIGTGVTIMGGASIGDGAVVAAGAIVTKDVEPYAIVGGIPAKFIKFRFDRALVERLLAVQWWQYDAADLVGIQFDDVPAALDEIERRVADGTLAARPVKYESVDKL